MQRTRLTLAFPLLLLLAPNGVTQDGPPGPAKELQALAPLVGSWQGSGTAKMAAETDEAMAWTATIDAEWIVDGHALREVTHVNLGEGVPPIAMETLYVFDAEAQRLAQYGTSTLGGLHVADLVTCPEAGTLVTVGALMVEGVATIDRSIMRFRGDSMAFLIERTQGGGPAFAHVSGTFKRAADGAKAVSASAPKADALAAPLSALQPMLGSWDFAGSYVPAPGVPAMKIKGVDVITATLDGQALATETTGTADDDPSVYKGYSVVAWDADADCFHQAWVDNMGMGGHNLLYQVEQGVFVGVRSGHQGGTPYVDRSELRCVAGKLASVRSDRMTGASPATTVFSGKYTPKQ